MTTQETWTISPSVGGQKAVEVLEKASVLAAERSTTTAAIGDDAWAGPALRIVLKRAADLLADVKHGRTITGHVNFLRRYGRKVGITVEAAS
jgi:hypothetical protein